MLIAALSTFKSPAERALSKPKCCSAVALASYATDAGSDLAFFPFSNDSFHPLCIIPESFCDALLISLIASSFCSSTESAFCFPLLLGSSLRDKVFASCAASLSVSETGFERGFRVFFGSVGLRVREVDAAGMLAVERQVEWSHHSRELRVTCSFTFSSPYCNMTSSKEDLRVSIETMSDWSHIKQNYTQAVRASFDREPSAAGMSKSSALSQHLDQVCLCDVPVNAISQL